MERLSAQEDVRRHSSASTSSMFTGQAYYAAPHPAQRPQTNAFHWEAISYVEHTSSVPQNQNPGLESDPYRTSLDTQSPPASASASGRVLTRRQRATIARAENTTPQIFTLEDQIAYATSIYGIHHYDTLGHPRDVSPTANLSANPADISPPSHGAHSRHASAASAFDADLFNRSPSSNYSRHSQAFERASSPASSVASSSITSLSGSLSYASQSTWSSVTGESPSPSRVGETDDVSSSASPEENRSQKEKHTKNKLRNIDRKEMCLLAERNPSIRQEDIAAKFKVERSTVSKVLKNKAHWLSLEDEDVLKIAKHRPIKFPAIENDVLQWVQERTQAGEAVTDASLREQAKLAAKRNGIKEEEFKASGGWIENFKQRNRIKRGKIVPARSERPQRLVDEDRASVSSSVDENSSQNGTQPVFVPQTVEPTPVGTPIVAVAPAPNTATADHRYATRSKNINAYQLQASVEMMRMFLHEVHPEGFTNAEKELWGVIEQRTMKWAVEQMQSGNGTGFS